MKNILLYSLAIITIYGCGSAMSAAVSEDLLSKEVILNADNKTKDQLFIDVNTWAAQYFNSAESVIDFSDKEAGRIVGKYQFSFTSGIYSYDGRTTLTMDMKDSKVRLVFTNPQFLYRGTAGGQIVNNSQWQPVKNKMIEEYRVQWDEMTSSVGAAINTKASDW